MRVVRDGDLIAVLHAHRDEADKALALVKAQFTPSPSTLDDTTIFDHLVEGGARRRDRRPKAATSPKARSSPTRCSSRRTCKGYVAHAPMETHSAVAAIENGKVTVW